MRLVAQQPETPEPGDAGPPEQTVAAQPSPLPVSAEPSTSATGPFQPRALLGMVGSLTLTGLKIAGLGVLVVLVALGIASGGLNIVPMIGAQTAEAVGPPHPNPVLPPAVPNGARADWAEWTYVQQINQVWGKDWPKVIEWFEEFNARYPGNPMVFDKLYAAYIEDGRRLMYEGDYAGARRRFEQAARFDPNRSEAADFMAELAQREAGR